MELRDIWKKKQFTICLADVNIAIKPIHGYIREYCREYLSAEEPEFSVEISQRDIDVEREISARQDELDGVPIRQFSNAYLETLTVYRRIAEKLLDYNVLLMHGSCIAVDGEPYRCM